MPRFSVCFHFFICFELGSYYLDEKEHSVVFQDIYFYCQDLYFYSENLWFESYIENSLSALGCKYLS